MSNGKPLVKAPSAHRSSRLLGGGGVTIRYQDGIEKRAATRIDLDWRLERDAFDTVSAQWRSGSCMFMANSSPASLLTLDATTLSYWNLRNSNRKRKHSDLISEWAAAIPSNAKPGHEPDSASNSTPPCLKRRTLSHIQLPAPIRQPSNTTSTKKARRDEELPNFVSPKWFRYTFVSTYIAFVSQTPDPWYVPIKKAVDAMQKIWDATSPFEYKITRSTPVYRKVRGYFGLAPDFRNK